MSNGYIYKIVCSVNNKIYVGQTKGNVERRWAKHLLDTRVRRCALHAAILKHGSDNFYVVVLEECSVQCLDERESFWICTLRSSNPEYGYNRTLGGQRGSLTDASRANLSRMRMGSGNPMFGKSHTEEVRLRMSCTRRGRPAHNAGKPNPRWDSHLLTVGGVTMTLADWSRRCGVSLKTLSRRVRDGWSAERAVMNVDGRRIHTNEGV